MSGVLEDVRASLGSDTQARRKEVAAWLARQKPGPLPAPAKAAAENVFEHFSARARGAACTIGVVSAARDISGSLGATLSTWSVPPRLVASPEPILRSWLPSGVEFETRFGEPTPDDAVGVVLPVAAVAETGTLVLRSSQYSPTALAFLPDYLVAILPRSRIVSTYEAGLDRVLNNDVAERNDVADRMPRCINFVTGPSRTADIEEILLLGAHGPRTVHILVIEDQ